MKTPEVDFRFPVLGFTRDGRLWGFPDLDRLTRCGPRTLREDLQAGMELIDAEGRHWSVRSFQRTGRAGSLLSLLLPLGPPQSRVEQELDALDPIPIEDLRRRACNAMETDIDSYLNGEPREKEFEPLLAKVREARSVAELYDLLQPDTFEPH